MQLVPKLPGKGGYQKMFIDLVKRTYRKRLIAPTISQECCSTERNAGAVISQNVSN